MSLKLSQITASGANPATTDNFVGVTAANADVLFTGAQVNASIAPVWSNITGNKVTLTQPATGSTLTIADGKTLTASNTVTLTATDGSTLAIGTGGTLGTAAFVNTGTSGATAALCNGANNFSGQCQFSAAALTAINISSTSGGIQFRGNSATKLRCPAASTYTFGDADAAAPASQTLSVQNVSAGNTNNSGAVFNIQGSLSNGSGAGGDIVLKTTLSTAASGTQNTAAVSLTLKAGTQRVVASAPVGLPQYTVATLPAGVEGDMAYVTDATSPTYLGTLTGTGGVVCPVFFNGTAWVSC